MTYPTAATPAADPSVVVPVRGRLFRPELGDLNDFRIALYIIWKCLGLGIPTKVQLDIAYFLQHGPEGLDPKDERSRRQVIMAFRGVGKTWTTAAFICWCLLMDPNLKILVVSKSSDYAEEIVKFCKQIIHAVPFFQHLDPSMTTRDQTMLFDVVGALPAPNPSVKALGIDGQLAGNRADIIIPDDTETLANSDTQVKKDKLWKAVKEFGGAILKPGGLIVYLGTPQVEDSLYKDLVLNRGYTGRIWPARYPNAEQHKNAFYWDMLAPMVKDTWTAAKAWQVVDTDRFNETDMAARELEYGAAGFLLQFMLDTSLSDRERYPLRTKDLIVLPLAGKRVPVALAWSGDSRYAYDKADLPSVGMAGDTYQKPFYVSDDWEELEETILQVDPSGRGKDCTEYKVLGKRAGMVYLLDSGGTQAGYDEATLIELSKIAAHWKVNRCRAEANYGDGMFTKLWEPVLARYHACTIEEHKSKGVKEFRMADTLEPVWQAHRIVVAEDVIRKDATRPKEQQLFHQASRLQRIKGCLKHDDGIDSLAMVVEAFAEDLGVDPVSTEEKHREKLRQQALDDFIRAAEQWQNESSDWSASGSEVLVSHLH